MKLFSVILCILCMLCTTASATESSSNSENVFHCSAGSTVTIDSRIFDEAVTVHGDPNASADTPGQLMFTNCTFTSNGENLYAVWMYNGDATFTNCTVTGHRGIKICDQYAGEVGTVVIDGCTFICYYYSVYRKKSKYCHF